MDELLIGGNLHGRLLSVPAGTPFFRSLQGETYERRRFRAGELPEVVLWCIVGMAENRILRLLMELAVEAATRSELTPAAGFSICADWYDEREAPLETAVLRAAGIIFDS